MIYILCMYAFLAITFIVSKDLLNVINPFLMIFVRMSACSLIFGMYALAKVPLMRLSYRYSYCLLILGFFNVYAANIFQLIGLEYIDPINASLWYDRTPFVIALFDFLFIFVAFCGRHSYQAVAMAAMTRTAPAASSSGRNPALT